MQQVTVRRFGDLRETHKLGKIPQLPKPEPAYGTVKLCYAASGCGCATCASIVRFFFTSADAFGYLVHVGGNQARDQTTR